MKRGRLARAPSARPSSSSPASRSGCSTSATERRSSSSSRRGGPGSSTVAQVTRRPSTRSWELAYLGERDLTLEAFVPSHPHKDHVGAVATVLASGSSQVAPAVAIYRSEDATWNLDKTWLNELRDTIAGHGNVEVLALRNAHREVVISEGVGAHLSREAAREPTPQSSSSSVSTRPGSSSPETHIAPTRRNSSTSSERRTSVPMSSK